MTYEEWVEKKKKEKAQKSSSYSEWVETTRGIDLDDIAPIVTTHSRDDDDDIATTKKRNQGYFQKSSVLDDGYQFGDIITAKHASEQDVRENIVSGILGVGEKIVDAFAWLAPAFNAGQNAQMGIPFDIDEYNKQKEYSTEIIKKDLYDEKALAQKILFHDLYEKGLGTTVEEASVFAEKSDALAQSVGQMGASALSGGLWWLTTGATAFGSQAEQALNEGASYEAAGASAAIAAGAEILTEKIGGIKFGNGLTLTDEIVKPLTNKISNKVVKALVDIGIDATGEGVEEYITEVCNQIGSSLYKEEDAWTILTSEEAVNARIDAVVGGMLMGGGFGTVNAVIDSGKANLTEQEQKVVDKVVEDRIAEESKTGKVSEAKKISIREEVIEDMDAGRISLDTIEEVHGGDTYKAYKDTVDSTESLKKELDELRKMPNGERNDIQNDRLAELKAMDFSDTSKQDGLKSQLRQEVYQMTKGSRLGNSYGENFQRTQRFEADPSKYKGKAQEFVKSVVESGKLNNSRKTHNYIDFLAKASQYLDIPIKLTDRAEMKANGQLVDQTSVLNGDGKTNEFSIRGLIPDTDLTVKVGDTVVNNYTVDYATGTITFESAPEGEVTVDYKAAPNGFVVNGEITLNTDSTNYLTFVAGHEITHILESAKHYDKLRKALYAYAESKGELANRRSIVENTYRNAYEQDENFNEKIEKELTADLVGDYLFTDPDFIENLYKQNQNLFKQLWDGIKHIAKMATAGSTEARELQRVQMEFERVFREGGKAQNTEGKTQFSLSNPETDKTYLDAVKRGDMETAQKMVESVAKDQGYTVRAYHGTARGDRVGNVFLPERATSGPMAFFTSDKTIAENYSKSKPDTSMAYDPDYDSYETQFRIKTKYNDMPLYKAWGYLPFDARNRITKKASQCREDWDGDNELMLDPDTNEANGGFQWQLKESRGNAIKALIEQWLNSGNLFNEESRFLDVLELTGVTEEFRKIGMDSLYFKDPNAKHEKVYDTFLKINNPFDTANVDEQFIADLEAWYEDQDQDQYVRENMQSDMWDKNGIDAYDFAERLRSDIEHNTTHAWTSIPDSVTDYLKSLGYDGIKDTGGKFGGDSHIVWIPFASEQVKSAEPVTYDDSGNVIPLSERFNTEKKDIRYSLSDIAGMSEKDYNHHGWAKVNDVLSKQELADFQQKVGDRERQGNWYYNLGDGRQMYAVGKDGVNSVLVISDGKFDAPSIEKVYHIDLDNETDIEIVRDVIYDGEKEGQWTLSSTFIAESFPDEIVRAYTAEDFFDFQTLWEEYRRTGSKRREYSKKDRRLSNRGRSNQRIGDHPVKASSTDGVFFDGQLSLDHGGEYKPSGNWNIYGKDIQYTPEDIAPPVSKTETTDIAPVAPVADDSSDEDRFLTVDDGDMLDWMDFSSEPAETSKPNDPFEERDWKSVGNQKTKAYMFENPEVKPYFQAEAQVMLGELQNSQKGERWYNDELYYNSGGEYGWSGTERLTTDDIAYLLDEGHYTYAQIEKGLKAIIEDNGKENNACSKRIEFLLNDRLRDGYTDMFGEKIPPNQEYLDMLEEKQVSEYSEESLNALTNSQAFDIAPPVENTVNTVDNIPPTDEHPVKEMSKQEDKVAKIVYGEKPQRKKLNAWQWAKEHIFSHGAIFEDLSLKTGNRELQAKFDKIRRAESMAQHFIGKGKNNVSALNDVRTAVEKFGKTEAFNDYMYHKHNIDRMSLESEENRVLREGLKEKLKGYSKKQIESLAMEYIRKDTPKDMREKIETARAYIDSLKGTNKPVFGDSVTADVSKQTVAKLEAENPEFKEYAEEIYGINKYLREMLVENGIISRDTAALWDDIYPHYVPIRRTNHDGQGINVPLDTNRTGVNAPIKRATGGNGDIYDLFSTMAERVEQTYKAVTKNRFGVELKNTLGTTIDSTDVSGLEEVLDSLDQHEELLQKGENGESATFTVFENGKRVKFEITDEMYEAMKPSQFTGTIAPLNKINNLRRDVLTTYSPTFALTNPIKDVQDILMNSQHPARTYASIPEAIKEVLSKGKWYQERMENGGDQDTYFDGQKKTFKGEKSQLSKIVGFPFEKIQSVNEVIEQVPRMAEYIASRKMGRSIDVSMLDSARVSTNFGATGDLTNMLNRNGATFLSASVEGFNQQVRNVREAKAEGIKGWAKLAAKTMAAGLPALLLNHALWDDDEEYEELSDYVKQNYYIVAKFGDGKFLRIPKGRTISVIQNAFEQMENLITGNDEVDLQTFGDLVLNNLAPNWVGDNWIGAPITQAIGNKAWYGGDLVPTRLQNLPSAEQYDETTDSISKWLGEATNTSPYKWNYILDQYSGGVGDMVLPYLTPSADGGGFGAAMRDKFTADSTLDNQNVTDFYDKMEELTVNANSMYATDKDTLKSRYINAVGSEISKLYAEKRKTQSSDLSDEEKAANVREIQRHIDDLAKNGLDTYNNVTFEDDYREGGEYARIGDYVFKKSDKGEWSKLSDDQLTKYEVTRKAGNSSYATDGENHYRWYVPGEDSKEDPGWRKITEDQLKKQKEVTSGLGINAKEYWDNKDEYDYAHKNPEKYSISKAVGGYDAYRKYSSELYDIKSDKDANGKTINGSRQRKVVEYINNLDVDYGARLILYKSEYPSDDTYNNDIVEYLNNRSDISYDEMVTILKELGFIVSADGKTVTWD